MTDADTAATLALAIDSGCHIEAAVALILARDAALRAEERQRAFAALADWFAGAEDADALWAAEYIRGHVNNPGGPGDGSGRRVGE